MTINPHHKIAFGVLMFTLICIGIAIFSIYWKNDKTKRQTIRVLTTYDAQNYEIGKDGLEKGFQYELVKLVCDSLQYDVEWYFENNIAQSIKLLKNGEVDIIARNLPFTSELRKEVSFSTPIVTIPIVLVQRTTSKNDTIKPIRDIIHLAGKTICIQKDSPFLLRIKNIEYEIADTINILEIENYADEQIIQLVAKGDFDYAIVDGRTAKHLAKKYPEIDIKTQVGFGQHQGWAFRKGDTQFQPAIDSFLTKIITKKQFRDLLQ